MRWFTVSFALLALTIVNTSAYPRIRRDAELQESENLSPLSVSPFNCFSKTPLSFDGSEAWKKYVFVLKKKTVHFFEVII